MLLYATWMLCLVCMVMFVVADRVFWPAHICEVGVAVPWFVFEV